ncbi:MAG: hypothetical protein IKV13_05350 [Akkermansia sp.]|nr:hypothetical protein [Akkermansia sp.]
MSNEGNLINQLKKKLKDRSRDEKWLAGQLTVSEETVRAWMSGEQPIPDNKRPILEKFVRAGGGITRPEGESRKMLSPDDIIN